MRPCLSCSEIWRQPAVCYLTARVRVTRFPQRGLPDLHPLVVLPESILTGHRGRRTLALPWPHKVYAACRSSTFGIGHAAEPDDFHHVVETSVAFPQALESRMTVAFAIHESPQLGDGDHGFTERELLFWPTVPAPRIHTDQRGFRGAARELPGPARPGA